MSQPLLSVHGSPKARGVPGTLQAGCRQGPDGPELWVQKRLPTHSWIQRWRGGHTSGKGAYAHGASTPVGRYAGAVPPKLRTEVGVPRPRFVWEPGLPEGGHGAQLSSQWVCAPDTKASSARDRTWDIPV